MQYKYNKTMSSPRLYLISPPQIDLKIFPDLLRQALSTEAVAAFQLRLKPCKEDQIKAALETLLPICHAYHIQCLINDAAKLVIPTGADGVHIGADDGNITDIRQLIGKDTVLGVSCYNSIERALDAAEAGAHYVSFGAFFPTATKQVKTTAHSDILQWWQKMCTIPAVAIGGITPDTAYHLIQQGADFIASIGSIWNHPEGPIPAIEAFSNALNR